jgi:hypothetical protein
MVLGLGALAGNLAGSVGSSLLAGGLDKLFGGGQPAQQGFTQVTLPQFDFTERNFGIASNTIADQLAAIGRGELPEFFQRQVPLLKRGLQRDLRTATFGLPGQRGESAAGLATAAASLGGLGPRRLAAGLGKVGQNFTQQSQAIDEFIASTGVNLSADLLRTGPSSIAQIPQGPQTAFVPFSQAGSSGPGFSSNTDFLDAASSGISDVFGNVFGGKKKKNTATDVAGRLTQPGNLSTIDLSGFGVGGGSQFQPLQINPVPQLSGGLTIG